MVVPEAVKNEVVRKEVAKKEVVKKEVVEKAAIEGEIIKKEIIKEKAAKENDAPAPSPQQRRGLWRLLAKAKGKNRARKVSLWTEVRLALSKPKVPAPAE